MNKERIWVPLEYKCKKKQCYKVELCKDAAGKIDVYSENGDLMAICKDGDLLLAVLTNLKLGYFE